MKEPKEVQFGNKTYILTKFPAWQGTLLMHRLPASMAPGGDFKVYTECLDEIFQYIFVPMPSGQPLKLSTIELRNNHIDDWEIHTQLMYAQIEYNSSFLPPGGLRNFLSGTTETPQA